MIQTHVFRDGIERPAHQHSNGGGWVADTATASSEAYIGPRAEVIGGTIEGGTIRGGAIYGGAIWGGTICGGTIYGGAIEGGVIYGGVICGGTICGGTIYGGAIRGGNVTRDVTFVCGAIPYQVTITDDFVGVGCQWHSPEHWREHGAEIMIEDGQTPERAAFFMGLLITFIDLHGCKTTVSANA